MCQVGIRLARTIPNPSVSSAFNYAEESTSLCMGAEEALPARMYGARLLTAGYVLENTRQARNVGVFT